MTKLKEEVIELIKNLPDEVDLTDIMAELYFRQRVELGLRQLDEGKGISHEDVEKRFHKWLT
ncbi:MAG: hypothetical protein NTW14_02960 [bacterium]|nr:hypothetical protein [bacterium]